ncbi:MAG: alpha/beta fold hydrolase [Bacteroidetes bacterium]|nr:alpha/beta fold hydrolase [Bacteroidota bacterium]
MKKIALFLCLLISFLTAAAQEEATIESNGSKLHYHCFGKGTPVLIINGGPGMNSEGFAPLAKELSANNETIIYDQRGTGQSSLDHPDSNNITMDLMIQDIENLRQHLKIERWIILGHSFGGMLASYYATKYPQHIKAIILSSSGGIDLGLLQSGNFIASRLTPEELKSYNYWSTKINDGDTSHYARLQRGMAMAPAYVYDKKNVPIIAERLTQSNSLVNGLVWENMQKIQFNCALGLEKALFPVLIIQGDNDIVSKGIAEKSHKAFTNSTMLFVPHAAHYGWLDNKAFYLSAVKQFLAKQK